MNFSSDIFYDDANSNLEWAKMGVLGVEMESAAVAQVAQVNGVPFAALRCISDLADDSAKDDCQRFEHLAAQRAAEIVCAALAGMEEV